MLQHLQQMDDPCVCFDIVNAGIVKGGRLDLECALVLLRLLDSLLYSRAADHTLAALSAMTDLVQSFGQLIRSARSVSRDQLGVDLSAEARRDRCQAFYEKLAAMHPRVCELARSGAGDVQRAAIQVLEKLRAEVDQTW